MKKKYLDNIYNNVLKDDKAILGLSLPMVLIYKHLFHLKTSILEEKFNLTHSEMDVLASLNFNNKIMSPTDLYESTIFSSGGMTKLLKKLEDKGLITRIPCVKDKRSLLVQITKKGEQIVQEAMVIIVDKDNEIFGILDNQEKKVMEKALKKLVYSIF